MEKSSISLRSILKAVHSRLEAIGVRRVKPADETTHACPYNHMDRYFFLFQNANDADMSKAFRRPAAQDQGDDRLLLGCPGSRHARLADLTGLAGKKEEKRKECEQKARANRANRHTGC